MADDVGRHGAGRQPRWPGAIGRFVAGFAIGAAATLAAVALFGDAAGERGILLLGLVLAGAGFAAALVGGAGALIGVWLGAAAPFAVPAFFAIGRCTPLSPIGVCAEPLGFALAGAFLLGGAVPEIVGFVFGRFVRWSLSSPDRNSG